MDRSAKKYISMLLLSKLSKTLSKTNDIQIFKISNNVRFRIIIDSKILRGELDSFESSQERKSPTSVATSLFMQLDYSFR